VRAHRRPPVDRNRLPRAILIMLASGAVKREDLYAVAAAVAGNRHAANVAIKRLAARGLLANEVRLTLKGRQALEGIR